MSAQQQKCCAVKQPLMDFLLTATPPQKKKKGKGLTTSPRGRNPGSSHILSAFLLDLKPSMPTEMAGLNLAAGRAGVCLPLYCTPEQLTEPVFVCRAVHPFGKNQL